MTQNDKSESIKASEMTIKVKLPPKTVEDLNLTPDDDKNDYWFEKGKPVVILGANGAGKTRFGVKIEELNDKHWSDSSSLDDDLLIHRIFAQKSLYIHESLFVPDFTRSQRILYYGYEGSYGSKVHNKYSFEPVIRLNDDFNALLTHLFAKEHKELRDANDKAKIDKKNTNHLPITTIVDTTTRLWNDLLPKRKIAFADNQVHILYDEGKYHGKEMSDGERVILYVICQILLLPPNSVVIIDEPEQHIHKALVKKLWDKLEESRPDCVIMYITHDLDFAASRNNAKFFWIKDYNGSIWDFEELDVNDYTELPPELLFELIGTRKKVLFIEGTQSSLDYSLYKELFREEDYHIIPCGGCQEVLKIYKAKKEYENLSGIEAHCLIDRDFRTDVEIEKLQKEGVLFLEVAEVENLFVVPELLQIMEVQLGISGAAEKAEARIIELFNDNKDNQIFEAYREEVNFQLTRLYYPDKELTAQVIYDDIRSKFSEINLKAYYDEKEKIFNSAKDIKAILRVFNFKKLSKIVSSSFGLTDPSYPHRVINILKSAQDQTRNEILEALKGYIPDLP